jgi:LuxR family transcriptional regulator, maltose regulon positive regulatory protein
LREWNKLEDAEQSLQQALALARQTWREVYLAPGYIVLAQILQARRQLAEANENLAKAVEVAQRLGHLPALRRAKAQQARLSLAQGNLMLAEQWSEAAGIRVDEELDYEREVEYLVLARLFIAKNRAKDAVILLDRLLQADEATGRIGNVIQSLALKVIAHQAVDDTEQAMKILERALSLAEPEDYIRVFVDEGVPMREVVSRFLAVSTQTPRALQTSVSLDYVRKLLAAFPQTETEHTVEHIGARTTEHPAASSALIEPLSIREQEVLELLAAGMSNQEIAKHLVVTEGTVKTHAKSIYGKLGVHSRTQAVARARELDLL